MSLIDASEFPALEGEDQTEQIRRELYAQILQDLTENQMDMAVNYSVLNPDTFKTPMDWIIDQATKALNAFDGQFPTKGPAQPIETGDKAP